jgi:hypothetical protein
MRFIYIGFIKLSCDTLDSDIGFLMLMCPELKVGTGYLGIIYIAPSQASLKITND